MNRNSTPYDQKLDAILSSAAHVFARKGYHNASIRDISKASGVSLSGLYYYFDSKEELLYLIQEHVLSKLILRIDSALEGLDEPLERLQMLMDAHLRYFLNNVSEMKVLSHEADSLGGDFRERVSAKKRHVTEIAAGILAELRPSSTIDPRVATFGLFGMMNWIYNWYREDRDVPADVLVADMSRLFLQGYLAEDEFYLTAPGGMPGSTSAARL